MPTKRAGTLGMFDLKFVNESRNAQINGKMLIASSSRMVGRMNSHAIVLSDRPRARAATRTGAPASRPVVEKGLFADMPDSFKRTGATPLTLAPVQFGNTLVLAFGLEDLVPVLDEQIERFLGRALISHDKVMHALLHVEQQFGIRGVRPEALDDRHRLEESRGERRTLREVR